MDIQEKLAYVILRKQINLAPLLLDALQRAHQSYSKILSLPITVLQSTFSQVIQFNSSLSRYKNQIDMFLKKIESYRPGTKNYAEFEERASVWEKKGVKIVTIHDDDYPALLKDIRTPPDLLFMRGTLLKEDRRSVSIAGTRHFSFFGYNTARKLGKLFALNKYTIINGFARGIDQAAVIGALEEKGRVISVLGSGVLEIYPEEHSELALDVIKNGAILSSELPESRTSRNTLQARNRITSALSLLNIFVEAPFSSGTSWQYKFSKEQGKRIATVRPDNSLKKQAEIPNQIIEEGGLVFEPDLSNFKNLLASIETKNRHSLEKYYNKNGEIKKGNNRADETAENEKENLLA